MPTARSTRVSHPDRQRSDEQILPLPSLRRTHPTAGHSRGQPAADARRLLGGCERAPGGTRRALHAGRLRPGGPRGDTRVLRHPEEPHFSAAAVAQAFREVALAEFGSAALPALAGWVCTVAMTSEPLSSSWWPPGRSAADPGNAPRISRVCTISPRRFPLTLEQGEAWMIGSRAKRTLCQGRGNARPDRKVRTRNASVEMSPFQG